MRPIAWWSRTQGLAEQPKKSVPKGIWIKCERCAATLYEADLDANFRVCSSCQHHFRMPTEARILTHCNAGGLATAGYGTALGVVRAAVEAGRRPFVWVDETRPVLQGARLTAWELAREGIPHAVIADVAAASIMARGEVDLVVVGADRIARNGDAANKIGTYGLAVLARAHGVPFYVAAPFSTISRRYFFTGRRALPVICWHIVTSPSCFSSCRCKPSAPTSALAARFISRSSM